MAVQWVDGHQVSVLNLDGSDPAREEHMQAVPRLVVYKLNGSDMWGTRCIEDNKVIPEMTPHWPSRDDAKRAIVEYAQKSLGEPWRSVVAHLLPR